jgi:hypothetical protein
VIFSSEGFGAVLTCSAISAALPRIPRIFARLAFLPVVRPVTVPIPATTTALLKSRRDDRADTYRSTGAETLELSKIPGELSVTHEDFRLRFFPDLGFVASTRRGLRAASIVRVEVQSVQGALVLHARQLASHVVWVPPLMLLFASTRLTFGDLFFGLAFAAALLVSFLRERENAKACVTAVALELKWRLVELGKDRPWPGAAQR